MPRNPDDLMSLQPSELKSLNDGEFRIYCGIKFESLERSYSKLDRRFYYLLLVMLSMLAKMIFF